MNIKVTANHGVHGEHGGKTRAYADCFSHPLGKRGMSRKLKVFAVPAVFAVVKQALLDELDERR